MDVTHNYEVKDNFYSNYVIFDTGILSDLPDYKNRKLIFEFNKEHLSISICKTLDEHKSAIKSEDENIYPFFINKIELKMLITNLIEIDKFMKHESNFLK